MLRFSSAALTTDDAITLILPPMAQDQTGWRIDSLNNRHTEGDNWIAHDQFPVLVVMGGCRTTIEQARRGVEGLGVRVQ